MKFQSYIPEYFKPTTPTKYPLPGIYMKWFNKSLMFGKRRANFFTFLDACYPHMHKHKRDWVKFTIENGVFWTRGSEVLDSILIHFPKVDTQLNDILWEAFFIDWKGTSKRT